MFCAKVIFMKNYFENCTLCPRKCGVNRKEKHGYCKVSDKLLVARASLHLWEEPCISGEIGSGTVFFGGCNLGCIYCQNKEIRDGSLGREISNERLAEIFLNLQEMKANNINLVTPTHFVPHIINALDIAKTNGLKIPVVYNSSGYENTDTLKMLDGYVDIYLPDFKYMYEDTAKEYSFAPDYTEYAKSALEEMVRQIKKPAFFKNGIMKRGVIVRHLMLPNHLEESKEIVKYIYRKYKDDVYISLMSQYTPMPDVLNHPVLKNKVSKKDYEDLIDFAVSSGVENGFIQEGESASESFIPPFDLSGV